MWRLGLVQSDGVELRRQKKLAFHLTLLALATCLLGFLAFRPSDRSAALFLLTMSGILLLSLPIYLLWKTHTPLLCLWLILGIVSASVLPDPARFLLFLPCLCCYMASGGVLRVAFSCLALQGIMVTVVFLEQATRFSVSRVWAWSLLAGYVHLGGAIPLLLLIKSRTEELAHMTESVTKCSTYLQIFDFESCHKLRSSVPSLLELSLFKIILAFEKMKPFIPDSAFTNGLLQTTKANHKVKRSDSDSEDSVASSNSSSSTMSSISMSDGMAGHTQVIEWANLPCSFLKKRISILLVNFHGTHLQMGNLARLNDQQTAFHATVLSAVKQFGGTVDSVTGGRARCFWAMGHERAASCALAIQQDLTSSLLAANGYGISIAYGLALSGNVGTDHVKYHTLITPLLWQSYLLEKLCRVLEKPILITDGYEEKIQHAFTCKPVDIVHFHDVSGSPTCVVHSLIGQKADSGKDQEWMYTLALDEQNTTKVTKKYLEGFAAFRKGHHSEALAALESCVDESFLEDTEVSRLKEICTNLPDGTLYSRRVGIGMGTEETSTNLVMNSARAGFSRKRSVRMPTKIMTAVRAVATPPTPRRRGELPKENKYTIV
eukprot:NODE_759_length_1891_cov_15.873583_g706_i0.p1 GENE.NODE_759_length_1891_cov_15.873583_g706_i0~~NODE_759_length_1891_cov_15.873583_g706_i0.p1  ORF type:complete len:619 (+),score=132.91 NODE_759_length_1891_cov_15.873583_g706_i0:46-1857(+)